MSDPSLGNKQPILHATGTTGDIYHQFYHSNRWSQSTLEHVILPSQVNPQKPWDTLWDFQTMLVT